MNVATHPRPLADRLTMPRGGWVYVWMVVFSLAVAAWTLSFASTPSYDPWSWLVWGREILHGGFHISGGSSWKPLPVIFTTFFNLFGSAAPNLWLMVARAGALLSVLMTSKLAMRVVWNLTLKNRGGEGIRNLPWLGRFAAVTPVLLAGGIAALGTAWSTGYAVDMLLGYSEGVMVGVLLIAVERAWDGHHRQAFALGIVGALDRPEFWIVWGPYGLWLMWKDRRSWPLVIGLGVLMLALWLGPQELGGGTAKGLVNHPLNNHQKGSAVNSSFPFWHELHYVVLPLVLRRVEVAAVIQILLTAALVGRAWRRGAGWMAALREHGAAVGGALCGIVGFGWWLMISVETQAGFAGNPRYAVLGTSLVYISGAAGYGWACLGLGQLAGAVLARFASLRKLLGDPGWSVRVVVSAALMTLVFLFIPDWFDHDNRLPAWSSIRYELRFQAQIRERTADVIREAGGPNKILYCGAKTGGSVMSSNLQVPMVAWYLGKPIGWIQATPKYKTVTQNGQEVQVPPAVRGPNVIFQSRANFHAANVPSDVQVSGWQQHGSHYKVINIPPVTLFMDCSSYSPT
jgi:hypothetical protein